MTNIPEKKTKKVDTNAKFGGKYKCNENVLEALKNCGSVDSMRDNLPDGC
jgi:hypothetical protein